MTSMKSMMEGTRSLTVPVYRRQDGTTVIYRTDFDDRSALKLKLIRTTTSQAAPGKRWVTERTVLLDGVTYTEAAFVIATLAAALAESADEFAQELDEAERELEGGQS
jgi:hypothetical protein